MALSVMRTPWWSSYFSLSPRRIEIVSSTDGSSTKTGWKRRASAASFSMFLRYSSSVVAPMQCSSPRASAGLSMLEASIAPSALPAPTSVCSSSMNRITSPAAATSCSTAFSRSSNSPRYFAPASSAPRSSERRRRFFSVSGTSPLTMRCAKPLDDGGLADAGFADQDRIVLGPAREHLDGAADFLVATDDRVELVLSRLLGEIARVFLERLIALLGGRGVGFASLAEVRRWPCSMLCAVTPAFLRMSAALVPLASASASSMYSTVTKESPAFCDSCSAWSNRRAVSGAR